jgi:23S rRNA A2030 N6-methylase RlmJ
VKKHTTKKAPKRAMATIVKSDFPGIDYENPTYPHAELESPIDRVQGGFSTFFRHAVLAKALTDITDSGGPVTFFNVTGANVSHQLKESHLHKDAIYLYKWLRLPLGLRRVPEGIHDLKPWLKQFAFANEDVPMDGFGFPKDLYLPGTDFIASRILRPQDKHVIFETREPMIDLANLAFKDDHRVEINTSGLYQESDLKSLIPCKGRAVIFAEINESTTYEQQARARNAIRGILKRIPSASFIITYQLHEDNHPWEMLDLFASTGVQTGYGTTQWADNMATERNLVRSIANDNIPHPTYTAIQHLSGNNMRPLFKTWGLEHDQQYDNEILPDTLSAFSPRSYWTGSGSMVYNVGHNYGMTLSNIGHSLRMATGKPTGLRYGISGPLFEPLSYEVGTGWGHKQSYAIPGISIPEDYLTMTVDEMRENLDRRLVDEVMDKVDYVPMKGGPTNLYDVSYEQFRLNPHTKRLLEPENVNERSRKENDRQTPLQVYNKLVAFARSQDANKFSDTYRHKWKVDHHGEAYDDLKNRKARLGMENQSGMSNDWWKPTQHEMENREFFRDIQAERLKAPEVDKNKSQVWTPEKKDM